MEKIITHVSNSDLKKSVFKNAQFILFAGSGKQKYTKRLFF